MVFDCQSRLKLVEPSSHRSRSGLTSLQVLGASGRVSLNYNLVKKPAGIETLVIVADAYLIKRSNVFRFDFEDVLLQSAQNLSKRFTHDFNRFSALLFLFRNYHCDYASRALRSWARQCRTSAWTRSHPCRRRVYPPCILLPRMVSLQKPKNKISLAKCWK